MFKRVGATIVTFVMLLSMACSFSSALPAPMMGLEVEIDGGATVVEPGAIVTANVKVVNPVALNGMTIVGNVDTDVFELAEEDITVNELVDAASQAKLEGVGIFDGDDDTNIKAAWFGTDNVLVEDGATVLSLKLKVKDTAIMGTSAGLSFRFEAAGMLILENGEPAALSTSAYSAQEAEENVVVGMPSGLVIKADKGVISAGETVKVTVALRDYLDNWNGLGIKLNYNKDLLEVTNAEAKAFGTVDGVEPVCKDGEVNAAWFNVENIVAETEVDLLEVTFTAKDGGVADFSASILMATAFDEEESAKELVPDLHYAAAAAKSSVEILNETGLVISADKKEVNSGETVKVTVALNNYKGDWNGLGVKLNFNENLFEIAENGIGIKPFGGAEHAEPVVKNGDINVAWFAVDNIAADRNAVLLEVTFVAKDGGIADFGASILKATTFDEEESAKELVAEEDYITAAEKVSVEVFDETSLVITTNKNEVNKGETVKVTVALRSYESDWNGLAIKLNYDEALFNVAENGIVVKPFGAAENADPVVKNGAINAAWFAVDNIAAEQRVDLLEVTFVAKAAGNTAFSGNIIKATTFDDAESAKDVPAENYEAIADRVAVTIVDTLPADKPVLSVVTDKDVVDEGEEIKATVLLNNYNDLWGGLAIKLNYNSELLEVKAAEIVGGSFGTPSDPVVNDAGGTVEMGFIATENIDAEPTVTLMEVTFVAKSEGTASFDASIIQAVSIGDGDSTTILTPEVDYYVGSESKDVVINDVVPTIPPSLEITTDKETVEAGDTVKVTVALKDYNDKWNALGVLLTYDKERLEIEESNIELGAFGSALAAGPELDVLEGKIGAGWIYDGDGNIIADDNVTLITATFKAKVGGDAKFGAKILSATTFDSEEDAVELIPDTDYVAAAEDVEIFVSSLVPPGTPYLSMGAAKYNIEEGEESVFVVTLNDYHSGWNGMAIEVNYDRSLIDITTADVSALPVGGAEPIVEVDPVKGVIRIAWIGVENLQDAEVLTLANITYSAKAAGTAVFSANFMEEGVSANNGREDVVLTPGDHYINNAAPFEVEIDDASIGMPYLKLSTTEKIVTEGESFTISMTLKDYEDLWNGLGVVLNYDPELLAVADSKVSVSDFGDAAKTDAVINKETGTIAAGWASLSNVNAEDDSLLMEVTFTAKKSGVAAFDASIKGATTYGNAGDEKLTAGTDYLEKSKEIEVVINPGVVVDKPYLEVVAPTGAIHKGDTFDVTVSLKNYNDLWAGMGIEGSYNKDVLELVNVKAENFGEAIAAPLSGDGKISAAWFHTANVDAAEDNLLLTLTFKAIDYGTASFNFNFKEEGVVSQVGNDYKVLVEDYDYANEAAPVELFILPAATKAYLTGVASATTIKQGDTVTVTVKVNDYNDTWNEMTILGTYDKSLLALVDATPIVFGDAEANAAIDEENGSISFAWANDAVAKMGAEFDAIVLTFKAIEAGTANFSFSFKGDSVVAGNVTLVPGTDYIADATSVDVIVITPCEHIWETEPSHKQGTSAENSVHVYECTKGCGAVREEACTVDVEYIDADCFDGGKYHYSCDVCGYDEYIADPNSTALGHDWSDKPTHNEGTHTHTYLCANGCGVSKDEDCSFNATVIEPTCMEDGYTLNICSACDYSFSSDPVAARGEHGALALRYYAPSETGNGVILNYCYDCQEIVGEDEGGRYEILEPGHPFPDVTDPNSWYYDAVNFCKAFGIFGGDTAGKFNPMDNITRGQLVTVLGRVAIPEAEKEMSDTEFNAFLADQDSLVAGMSSTEGFTDLNTQYYARYAKLFAKWGIVNGYTDGTFKGDKTITREEMATLLKRFVEAYTGDVNVSFGDSAAFNDMNKVSGWAKENVEWVGQVGLFKGDGYKNFNPAANANRAEIAVVIFRMLPVLQNIEVYGVK